MVLGIGFPPFVSFELTSRNWKTPTPEELNQEHLQNHTELDPSCWQYVRNKEGMLAIIVRPGTWIKDVRWDLSVVSHSTESESDDTQSDSDDDTELGCFHGTQVVITAPGDSTENAILIE
jgi:hypothetical protein